MFSHDIFKDKKYNAKMDELHFINQVIRNLTHLERLYNTKVLKDESELSAFEQSQNHWRDQQFKVNGELNDLRGYGTYEPKI